MRLVTFIQQNSAGFPAAPAVGALLNTGEYILDFAKAVRREGIAPPVNLLDWFDLDGHWLRHACAIYDSLVATELVFEADQDALVKRTEARLLAPVPRPGKLICIGLNYRDHAAESNMPIPEKPVIFSKFTTSVVGPDDPVVLPKTSSQVDYEAELAVVIGRRAKEVPLGEALEYVLGYTMINDVSARDFQFGDGQWQRGKSCDTFAPMGISIVTKDEVADPQQLGIRLRVNGQ